MTKVNKKYKDRLFRLVFGDRRRLLDLYNALNGSHYEDPDALEITTLDDAVYLSMKNDLSFLVNGVLNLYEHQSTYNPNMPVRGFFYLADVYRKYVVEYKLNLYGSRLAKLPAPKYLVFYNGRKEEPDRKVLRLSDAFQGGRNAEPCLELCAVMLNINLGHNQELMERCRTLKEYAQFVDRVRRMIAETGALESAVDRAVKDCIRDGILENFLSSHRAEVLDVILTDYNEQEYIAMEREEAWEDGKSEGLTEGLSEGLSVSREAILDLLGEHGEIPEELRARICAESDKETLKRWTKLAAKAESLEDFTSKYGS